MDFSKNKIRFFIVIAAFLFCSIFSPKARSHPHVFVTQRIEIIFDDKGLAGFKVQWQFDEMFSSMIVGDYDKNSNRKLEANEVAVIEQEAFSYISNYDYFTFVKIDGKPFKVRFVKDFRAELRKNILIYTFLIPCHVAARSDYRQIVVATYDPSYYSAVFYAENRPAALANAKLFEVKTSIRQDKSTAIYYDQVNPWALFLDFRKKP